MPNLYSSLALSYRKWYYRMTTKQWDYVNGFGPAAGFAALQGFNIFSLAMLLFPLKAIPSWFFAAVPSACGLCAFWLATRIYRAHPERPSYAKNFNAAVPNLREFPFVYLYFLGSFALFACCFYVVIQHMA